MRQGMTHEESTNAKLALQSFRTTFKCSSKQFQQYDNQDSLQKEGAQHCCAPSIQIAEASTSHGDIAGSDIGWHPERWLRACSRCHRQSFCQLAALQHPVA